MGEGTGTGDSHFLQPSKQGNPVLQSCKQEAVSKKMPWKSDDEPGEREFPLTTVLRPNNSQSLP